MVSMLRVSLLCLYVSHPMRLALSQEPLALLHGSGLLVGERMYVGVATDGDRVLVGTTRGRAVLFDPFTEQQLADFTLPDSRFGPSVALDGDFAAIGNRTDAAFVVDFSDLNNVQSKRLVPDDRTTGYGFSVDIAAETVIVGAGGDNYLGSFTGSAFLFDRDTASQVAKLTANDAKAYDNFGISVAIDGDQAVVGSVRATNNFGDDHGAVYLFDASRTHSTARQIAKYSAAPVSLSDRPSFGYNVDISGDTIMALETFGPNLGPARAYQWQADGNPAILPAYSTARNFGDGLNVNGAYSVIGDYSAGQVYLYDQAGSLLATINSPEPESSAFGAHVSVGGDLIVTNGVGQGSGAVYVYSISQILIPEPSTCCMFLVLGISSFALRMKPV